MAGLKVKSSDECKWDAVSLGEIMLRLDPGDTRIRTARELKVWEGGGEYNVTRGLKKCFGMRTAVVTAIVDNEIGRLLEDFMMQGGVDLRHVNWIPFDGIGKASRVGLNFTEKGYGVRAAQGCVDRARSAASQMKPGDVDWDRIFKDQGARWFHTGGIFAALSEGTQELVIEATKAAKENGTIVSYDLNFRASLWKSQGGPDRAKEVNGEIAKYVDVMLGNEEDFTAALGFEVPGVGKDLSKLDPTNFKAMINEVVAAYPNFAAVATTLRNAKTATVNDWGAILYLDCEFHEAMERPDLEIFDRVGGGDSFASGLIYGFLTGKTPDETINYGAAHGALAMTTPGDTSMATLAQVEKIMKGGTARVDR